MWIKCGMRYMFARPGRLRSFSPDLVKDISNGVESLGQNGAAEEVDGLDG